MGNLEKAGIGVVVVLLAIILVVAFVTDPARKSDQGTRTDGGTAEVAKTDPKAPLTPLQRSRTEAPPLRVVDNNNSGLRTIRNESPDPKAEKDPEVTPLPKSEPVREDPKPPTPSESPALATPGWPREVKLGDGESLWKVAEREYGRALADRMVPLMQKESGIKDARRLATGATIKLPAPPEVVNAPKTEPKDSGSTPKTPPAPKPSTSDPARRRAGSSLPFDPGSGSSVATPVSATGGSLYIVKDTDTLASIARRELGSVQRVAEIVKLNGIKDPNRVLAGTKLRLPAKRP